MSIAIPAASNRFAQPAGAAWRLMRRLVAWWLAELAACIPARLRISRRSSRVVLVIENEAAHLFREAAGEKHLIGNVSAGAALLRLARGTAVWLQIPAARALRAQLTLPAATEDNLRRVLEFELDRRTPFTPDAVYFTHRVLHRHASSRQIEVELTVVPRKVVDELMAAATGFGVQPTAVEVAGETGRHPGSGNLLPTASRRRQSPTLLLGLGGVALALAVGALAFTLLTTHERATALRQELQGAKQLAARAAQAQQALNQLAVAERALIERRRATPAASELLLELTRLLPDDTWLSELGLSTGEIRLLGYSTTATALIERLGRSSLLAEPRFRAAVTQDPTAGRERFELGARVARRLVP